MKSLTDVSMEENCTFYLNGIILSPDLYLVAYIVETLKIAKVSRDQGERSKAQHLR